MLAFQQTRCSLIRCSAPRCTKVNNIHKSSGDAIIRNTKSTLTRVKQKRSINRNTFANTTITTTSTRTMLKQPSTFPKPSTPATTSNLKRSKRLFGTKARQRNKSTLSIKAMKKSNNTRTNNNRALANNRKTVNTTTTQEYASSTTQSIRAELLAIRTIPIPRWISPRQHTFKLAETFGHLSFILVATSYATEDFLLLRIIATAGHSCIMIFNYFHPHGRILWLPFRWNAVFICINAFQIGKIVYHRYMAIGLSQDLKRIKHEHFDAMEWSDYEKLVSIAKEEIYEDGDLMIYQGQQNRYLRLVLEGKLKVCRDTIHTYTIEEGNFISEAGLHAGLLLSGDIESCCSITANNSKMGKTRVLVWDRSELIELLKKESGLRRALTASLSWDIVRKLKGQRKHIARQMVDDPKLWTRKRREQSEDRYASILQNMLRRPDYLRKRRVELDKYRIIHHIDDETHKLALEKCGWTVEEYEAGQKREYDDDEDTYGEDGEDRASRRSGFTDWNITSRLARLFS